MIKVGIVGATGYTGAELVRLLLRHPEVEIACITARSEVGKEIAELFPNLRGQTDLRFSDLASEELEKCDALFFATPHGVCMQKAKELLDKGVKIIDLSADFRIKNLHEFQNWYAIEHSAPELLTEAVYGLPETHREEIKKARLIANPGCYPTAVQLGMLPALQNAIVETFPLIADVKSGISGAGRGAKVANLFAETGESFKAYGASGHRHQVEIEQELSNFAGEKISLNFVPHLLPIIRGIEATLYMVLKNKEISDVEIFSLYEERYKNEEFVIVLPLGETAETRSVRGSNFVHISLHRSPDKRTLIVSAVEDNLVKGAAGQAIQNLNLMFGLPENTGLMQLALLP
ncbi:MAG: N-acetyl-gamma-glutamyl-phosphate reductase [Cardiobacteriaceae bacterium]|nr:N-acetyl-gamma-glutamyl-phosphate reductase [Cardiobacteriaceae bacterium]